MNDSSLDGRLALVVGTVAVAFVYAASGTTIAGRLPTTGGLLLALAALELAWLCGWRLGAGTIALRAGALLNASLVVIWVLSRVKGLPIGDPRPQPVGVLDSLCAADAAVLSAIAWSLGRGRTRAIAPLSHLGITVAVAALAALASGHEHSPAASSRGATGSAPHYFCRLL